MGCKAGYPSNPCPFGWEGRVTRADCGACKFFIPPPHILAWCMLYDREGKVCQLPKSACEQCPEKHVHGPGRIPGDGKTDWGDPASVRAYFNQYRKDHPGKAAEAMVRFLGKSPDYFKRYRELNRDKMRAAGRRYYQNKKRRAAANGSGQGEV